MCLFKMFILLIQGWYLINWEWHDAGTVQLRIYVSALVLEVICGASNSGQVLQCGCERCGEGSPFWGASGNSYLPKVQGSPPPHTHLYSWFRFPWFHLSAINLGPEILNGKCGKYTYGLRCTPPWTWLIPFSSGSILDTPHSHWSLGSWLGFQVDCGSITVLVFR